MRLTRAQVATFRDLPPARQRALLARMSPVDMLAFDALFEIFAHEGQLPPDGDGWRLWLMLAGRGFGKTRAGAEWVLTQARTMPMRIALVGATMDEARRVMVEGNSGILTLARKRRIALEFEPGMGRLTFRNGSVVQLYSGDNPNGLRGPEHHLAWCDEIAKWRRAGETWDNLNLGLRLGRRSRALVTTTPRAGPLIEKLRGLKNTVETGGSTRDNVVLSPSFLEAMLDTYGGTRLGEQEIEGRYFAEQQGSLFPRELLARARGAAPPMGDFDRVVVAVDPPASDHGDWCGIAVAGRAADGTIWLIDDASVAPCRPEAWAARAAALAREYGASHIVAEANNGGTMVESCLNAAESGIRVRLVHASRGKAARAEPVAVRMERGRVRLGGRFEALEAELNGLVAGGRGNEGGHSPDRADAFVWAVTELSETRSGVPRVMAL